MKEAEIRDCAFAMPMTSPFWVWDVAETAVFLAGSQSNTVIGQPIAVNHGVFMQ